MKHPLFIKLAALAAITVLLLVGLGMIGDVVRDRLRYRSITAQSVADSLAGAQTLIGPGWVRSSSPLPAPMANAAGRAWVWPLSSA